MKVSIQGDPLTRRIIACAIEVHKKPGEAYLKNYMRHDPIFEAQILSYTRLTNRKIGLLINFNSKMVKDGIQRFVL